MKPVILVCALLALAATTIHAEVSRGFGKQAKALIDADIADLVQDVFKKGEGYVIFHTALKLTGFEVTYITSFAGNILSAKYLSKAVDDDMDIVYEELNTIPCLVFDSKYKPGLIKKGKLEENIARKIVAKSRDTGKNLLEVTLDKAGALHIIFARD